MVLWRPTNSLQDPWRFPFCLSPIIFFQQLLDVCPRHIAIPGRICPVLQTNSCTERVFSVMNSVWSGEKCWMSTDTIKAVPYSKWILMTVVSRFKLKSYRTHCCKENSSLKTCFSTFKQLITVQIHYFIFHQKVCNPQKCTPKHLNSWFWKYDKLIHSKSISNLYGKYFHLSIAPTKFSTQILLELLKECK